jgi:hypothetical protein
MPRKTDYAPTEIIALLMIEPDALPVPVIMARFGVSRATAYRYAALRASVIGLAPREPGAASDAPPAGWLARTGAVRRRAAALRAVVVRQRKRIAALTQELELARQAASPRPPQRRAASISSATSPVQLRAAL